MMHRMVINAKVLPYRNDLTLYVTLIYLFNAQLIQMTQDTLTTTKYECNCRSTYTTSQSNAFEQLVFTISKSIPGTRVQA